MLRLSKKMLRMHSMRMQRIKHRDYMLHNSWKVWKRIVSKIMENLTHKRYQMRVKMQRHHFSNDIQLHAMPRRFSKEIAQEYIKQLNDERLTWLKEQFYESN